MRTTSRPLAALAVLLTTALAGIPALSFPADARGDRDRDSVSRAAERYGLSETELKAMLEADPDLRVAGPGLYYVDPAAPESAPGPMVVGHAFPLSETFELHSKPGSQRTIYLDFNGENVSDTWWNGADGAPYTVPNMTHPAWTLDGNPGSFSDTERMLIQDVFLRVAEDYAPFDVDVTTEEPDEAALTRANAGDQVYGTRALITPSQTALDEICGGGCGGVAFLDVFDIESPSGVAQPAWVFPQNLGPDNAKYIADATTHEVGHNLSLMHDGTTSEGYYSGHGANADPFAFLWGPIMGAPYDAAVTQWGLNDYPGGKLGGPGGDPDGFQANVDDIVTISESGAPIRSDEAGGTVATAAATIPGTGYISSRTDVDVYNLGTCSGTVTVAANNAAVSPNLDIKVELLSAGGTQLAVHDPPAVGQTYDVAGGLDATVTATGAPSGTYYARIDGVGAGNATTSYTDYGSVGAYTLQVSGCDNAPPVTAPSVPRNLVGVQTGEGVVDLDWDVPSTDGGGVITQYNVYLDGTLLGNVPGSSTAAQVFDVAGGEHDFGVAAVNSAGEGPQAHVTVEVDDPDPEAKPGKPIIGPAKPGRKGGPKTATVSWLPPTGVTNPPIDGFEFIAYKQNRQGRYVRVFAMEFDEVFPNVKYTTPQRGLYKFAVRAHNGLGYGPLSAKSNAVRPR